MSFAGPFLADSDEGLVDQAIKDVQHIEGYQRLASAHVFGRF